MPKFTVAYEVTSVVSGQVEIEAESEIQARLLVEGIDLSTLEADSTEVESWFVEVTNVKETA